MIDSIYTPPKARLNVEPAGLPAFFTVSPTKLMTMLWATSGLYGLYWLYKNWALYKQFSGRSIWPIPRTLLGLIFLPSLFCKLDRTLREQGKGGMPYWWGHAALLIVNGLAPALLSFFNGLVRGLGGQPLTESGVGQMFAISFITLLIHSLILLRVQRYINVLNDDSSGHTNARLSKANWLWIAIGMLYWYAGYAMVAKTIAPSL